MKNNSKKHEGFTLIEIIISMALIAIISVGVYNAYLVLIKQTKAGQAKQMSALEGKKIMEELQANDLKIPNNINSDAAINVGDITFKYPQAVAEDAVIYKRYLNENYSDKDSSGSDVNEISRKYTETVTLKPTQADGENVILNDNNLINGLNNNNCRFYIGKENSGDYITDNPNQHESNNLPSEIDENSRKIVISVYLDKSQTDQNKEDIKVKDYKGSDLLSMTNDIDKSLYINFSQYDKTNNSSQNDAPIEINIYNRTEVASNIYIEKSNSLNVNTDIRKGQVNIYDNRAENTEKSKIGTLYDIKVEIKDYKKDIEGQIKEDKDNLFTGYSKKNIK
ncbi:type IV pilus modification PilV family protein [Clostridium saccharobutylicum]|uniref:Prepilin-type N-terminal cleavage/methylation domain-containing protein n=1 Tax=Clostridium saccharobutylicum DSM 13864 TaxID=1345695 RepID=U5MNJ2_CLOSA|nr:type II secretion system protein [Clostridium saccharobutylicum]AGX42160.1 prepilin-type N-terminal cleavage/methylation domain-containing protein [Clostridium saccharobutylicum DSM 13864]AQR89440.1 hypothetical protein CLOSC_11410 [Clostridium saccharobutylicum]AQR99342.1 hypothetical protein CSACC_11490 [Clostridium saccharobutylicum]AQS13328.1 hypothetical protein CLOSACC_11490 [Clostridium saccharobutylicum]MBA2904483.1 prepilin-type N-terminal cleavage/methylation domain-containing pro